MKFDEKAFQQANSALDYDSLAHGSPEDVTEGLRGHLAPEDLDSFQHFVGSIFDG